MARRTQRTEPDGPDPYHVLGITPLATMEEATAAYRALAQVFHPDRHLDSPEPVRREAEQRMRALNQAFVMLKKGTWRPPTPAGHVQSSWAPDPNAGPEARRRAFRAARQHTAQARAAQASRTQAKQSVPGGQARPGPKDTTMGKIGFGLAQAMITNELTCRGCGSVQHLPAGWQDRLRDTSWACSSCNRIILSW